MAVTAMKTKSSIDSVREIIQDFLVPELKAIKISIDSIHTEIKLRDEKQSQRSDHLAENIRQLSDRIDKAIEIRERHAALEARVPAK